MMNIINEFKKISLSSLIYRFIASILLFNIINLVTHKFHYTIDFMQHLSMFSILLRIFFIFIVFSVTAYLSKRKYFDYSSVIILLFICSLFWLNDNNIFFITIIFLIFLLLYYFRPKDLNISINNKDKIFIILIIIFGYLMFSHISIVGILRYKLFNSPNFDLGIPGQNFYYMKKIGIPLSTCERDMLINHFAIHFSLIFYLILPVYYLFSHVTTLQIISGILISSSIIPIYLLCNKYKLSKWITFIICLIFSSYAPAICSSYFDFHENIFLMPLLLWLFYFYEKKKSIGIIISSILILLVKEDAPIYLVIFSIFMIFDKKRKYGIPLLIFSILYFIMVTYLLKVYGDGIMVYRYKNLTYNDSGMIGIIKTILINPGYFIKTLITDGSGNLDKIKYILQLLLPLGFIPLYAKEKRNYLLLIPLFLTLMTTYEYSYDIGFHYSCGIIAFLFYVFIKNIKEINIRNYLIVCLIISILTYRTYAFPYLCDKIHEYVQRKAQLNEVEELLKEIPKEASVNASTFIVPHIINRDVIYEVYYHQDMPDVDYVVLDINDNDYMQHYKRYINNGYMVYKELKDVIMILKK